MTDPASEARNLLLSILTATRAGDMQQAIDLTNEYHEMHNTILPLFVSAVAFIDSVINSVGESIGLNPDDLFKGICLGLSVRAIEDRNRQEPNQ